MLKKSKDTVIQFTDFRYQYRQAKLILPPDRLCYPVLSAPPGLQDGSDQGLDTERLNETYSFMKTGGVQRWEGGTAPSTFNTN